jgi:hypothetical protein
MWWVAGCYFEVDGYDGPRASGVPADHDALVTELEAHREWFGGEEIGEMWAAGDQLYWLEYRAWNPTLHGLDTAAEARVDYDVQLVFERLSLALGERAFATSSSEGGQVRYRLFSALSPQEELTSVALSEPGPYAVDGTDLYVVQGGELYRVGEAGPLAALDGELWGFGVDGERVVFVEGGRLGTLALGMGQLDWVDHEHVVEGTVQFDQRGVLFTTYGGLGDEPWYYSLEDGSLTDLDEALAALPAPAGLAAGAHHFEQDLALWGERLVYGGAAGIFLYDPAQAQVTPVLLEPRTGPRVDYRYPVVTDSGSLFVTGLTSDSGAVGADGPVYRVELGR